MTQHDALWQVHSHACSSYLWADERSLVCTSHRVCENAGPSVSLSSGFALQVEECGLQAGTAAEGLQQQEQAAAHRCDADLALRCF
jgi:hypothetical protein